MVSNLNRLPPRSPPPLNLMSRLEVQGAKDLLDGIDDQLADAGLAASLGFNEDADGAGGDADAVDSHSVHFTPSEVAGPPDVSQLLAGARASADAAQQYVAELQYAEVDTDRQALIKHATQLQLEIERLRVRDEINGVLIKMADANSEDEVVQARMAGEESEGGCRIS